MGRFTMPTTISLSYAHGYAPSARAQLFCARVGECVDAPISERSAYELGWGLAGFKDLLHYHWTATGVPLSVWGVD